MPAGARQMAFTNEMGQVQENRLVKNCDNRDISFAKKLAAAQFQSINVTWEWGKSDFDMKSFNCG